MDDEEKLSDLSKIKRLLARSGTVRYTVHTDFRKSWRGETKMTRYIELTDRNGHYIDLMIDQDGNII